MADLYAEELERDTEEINQLPEGLELEEESDDFLERFLDAGNIVDQIEDDNASITSKIIDLFDEANRSMTNWGKKYKRAINLSKLQAMSGDKEITEKTFPFEGASLAMLPFVTEAMLDFNSRTAPELAWTENIINAKIYGENSKEKEERAKRVARYTNYQLTEGMINWRDEQDKLLMILPCTGTCYKKTYFNYDKKLVESELYLADEIIFDMKNKNFVDAPDKFIKREYTRNEVVGFIRGEQGWDLKEDDLEEDKEDFEFIEAYTWIDVDEDGLKEPYVAIICIETAKIVALYPYFDEDTINRNDDGEIISIDTVDCFTQYRFLPDPEGGPMGLGWGILFGPMFDSINTNLRQLIDAGTLTNTASNSGLIALDTTGSGRGNSIQSGPIDVKLGQLTPISVRGSLRDSVVQFPFAGPNATLFQLMDYLITSARSMTNAAINVEANAGEAASLYLARLQQGLKVPNSITMRVYSSAKKEFKKIGLLDHKHFDDEIYNKILDEENQASMKADFDPKDCDIALVADPSKGSDIERIQRAEAVLQEAKLQPQQIINLRLAYIEWLESMKTPNIEELAPEPDPDARDPMQEIMVAQMQMEAELKQEELAIRKQKITTEMHALAMKAAAQAQELEFESAKKEREVYEVESQVAINIAKERLTIAEAEAQEIENDMIRSGLMGVIDGNQESAS